MQNPNTQLKRLRQCLDGSGVLITAALLIAAWLLAFRPLHSESRDLTNRQGQLKRFLQTRDALRSSQQKSEHELQAHRQEVDELLARIPRDSREADFLDLLSETATDTGITLHNFRPLASQPGTDIGRTQIQLSGSGPFVSLLQFLDQLRTGSRMNRVSRLELGVADADRSGCTVELTIDLFFNAQAVGS